MAAFDSLLLSHGEENIVDIAFLTGNAESLSG